MIAPYNFIRENDLVYNKDSNLTFGSNRFFIPETLYSITLRHTDFELRTYDGFKIIELNSKKRDTSKINYFHYLKTHGFIDQDIDIQDYFELNKTNGGCLNVFPVSIKGRGMDNSLLARGFRILLEYNGQGNNTNWFLCIRWIFSGVIDIKKNLDNLHLKFDYD